MRGMIFPGIHNINGSSNPRKKINQVLIIKNKNVYFFVPADHRIKITESEKINKYLDLFKAVKHECNGDNNCRWCIRNTSNKDWQKAEGIENQK